MTGRELGVPEGFYLDESGAVPELRRIDPRTLHRMSGAKRVADTPEWMRKRPADEVLRSSALTDEAVEGLLAIAEDPETYLPRATYDEWKRLGYIKPKRGR